MIRRIIKEITRNQYDIVYSAVDTDGIEGGIEEATYDCKAVEDVSVIDNTELEPYYDILNLNVTISEESVTNKAFREIAKKYHPLYGTEPDKDKYDEIVIAKDKLLVFYIENE